MNPARRSDPTRKIRIKKKNKERKKKRKKKKKVKKKIKESWAFGFMNAPPPYDSMSIVPHLEAFASKMSPILFKLPLPLFLLFLASLRGLTQYTQTQTKDLHGKVPPSLWYHLLHQENSWKVDHPKGFDGSEEALGGPAPEVQEEV